LWLSSFSACESQYPTEIHDQIQSENVGIKSLGILDVFRRNVRYDALYRHAAYPATMEMAMITGMHAVVYTRNAEADRAFFRDVLGFSSVDAGGGWLIFAAPPSELACHPAESNGKHELYLICDDLRAEIARLGEKGIACGPVSDQGWGLLSTVRLPGGGDLGLYEPHHPTAYRQSH
jgi:catechol 2,3-dioxygenase-like lactoylglutathione lyase family enzyme